MNNNTQIQQSGSSSSTDSQYVEQISVDQKSDDVPNESASSELNPSIVLVDLNRKKVDVPLKAIKCPKPLYQNEIIGKSEPFRRPFFEDVTIYERENGPFNLDKNDVYSSIKNSIADKLANLNDVDVDTSSQTEFAMIGPSGCSKYLHKYERGETNLTGPKKLVKGKTKFVSSLESMILLAERSESEPGEVSKLIDKTFNNTWRVSESFRFSIPRAKHYIEMKNNKQLKLVSFKSEDSIKHEIAGLFDTTKCVNSIEIEVRFDSVRIIPTMAKIVLKNVNDVERTKEVCQAHSLIAESFGTQDEVLLIHQIPKKVNDSETLQWFMERILSANNIEIELVYFVNIPLNKVCSNSWNKSRFSDARMLFARNLLKHDPQRQFWENDVKIFNKRLDSITSNVASHPFKIEEKLSTNFAERILVATYDEKNVDIGLTVASVCHSKRHQENFMKFTTSFSFTRIVPKYRRMISLSRDLRIASDQFLTELDHKLRYTFFNLEQSSPDEFEKEKMDVHHLRLVDEYDEKSTYGFTGVEGWPPIYVDGTFAILEKYFEPKEIVITEKYEKFVYGLGEILLKYIIQKTGRSAIVDIDQFQSKFVVFGSDFDKFSNNLSECSTDSLNVKARIPCLSPYFNDMTIKCFTRPVLKNMGELLSSNIIVDRKEKCVDFDGPYDSFDLFCNIMTEINQKIFEKYASNLPDVIYAQTCPICLSEIDANYYRLDACGHVYCRICLNQQIRSAFGSIVSNLKCHYQGCNKSICPMDVQEIVIGGRNRIRILDSQKLQKMFSQTSTEVVRTQKLNFKSCTTPDCLGLFKPTKRQTTVQCPICLKIYCGKCMDISHPETPSCIVFKRLHKNVNLSLEAYMKRKGPSEVKKCPNTSCTAIIEKDFGCNHMICITCKTHFCWICDEIGSAHDYEHIFPR